MQSLASLSPSLCLSLSLSLCFVVPAALFFSGDVKIVTCLLLLGNLSDDDDDDDDDEHLLLHKHFLKLSHLQFSVSLT